MLGTVLGTAIPQRKTNEVTYVMWLMFQEEEQTIYT